MFCFWYNSRKTFGIKCTFRKLLGLIESTISQCRLEAEKKNVKILLPVDVVCAENFDENAEPIYIDGLNIPENLMGMDIGKKTIEIFVEAIKNSKTLVWNGPMGVFEFETFAVGTKALAQAVAETDCNSIIGGGDTASAIINMGFKDKISHVSTGGGASLKMLEGKLLDGIQAISDKE